LVSFEASVLGVEEQATTKSVAKIVAIFFI
jgi:hypothetical protein